MIVCAKCGSVQDETKNKFCSNCGQPIMIPKSNVQQQRPVQQPRPQYPVQQAQPNYNNQNYNNQNYNNQNYNQQNINRNFMGESGLTGNEVLEAFIKMVRTDYIIWLVVGIVQLVLGVVELLFCYGISVIILGVWNIVNSMTVKKNAAYWENNPSGIYEYYEPKMAMIIVFLCLNLFLGSIVGVIGSIYDLVVRNYVISHKDDFLRMEGRR